MCNNCEKTKMAKQKESGTAEEPRKKRKKRKKPKVSGFDGIWGRVANVATDASISTGAKFLAGKVVEYAVGQKLLEGNAYQGEILLTGAAVLPLLLTDHPMADKASAAIFGTVTDAMALSAISGVNGIGSTYDDSDSIHGAGFDDDDYLGSVADDNETHYSPKKSYA
jgi:hypothetical protein